MKNLLTILLVLSLVVGAIGCDGDTPTATTIPITVTRGLPDTPVCPGDIFDVTVTFASPEDNFTGIGLTDNAGDSNMSATVNTTLCTPNAGLANSAGNKAEYVWVGSYNAGTSITAVYQVTVDPAAPIGNYTFDGGLEYYVGGVGPTNVVITGDMEIEVVEG